MTFPVVVGLVVGALSLSMFAGVVLLTPAALSIPGQNHWWRAWFGFPLFTIGLYGVPALQIWAWHTI